METLQRILVLGGGPGGTMVANHLARRTRERLRRGSLEIRMVTASPCHVYQPGFLFVALGEAPLAVSAENRSPCCYPR
ncbi:MAG: hypothetical protein GX496_10975 [Firmicutes bacterium]|nr:hypothetical protein [Bacillota bacterium]